MHFPGPPLALAFAAAALALIGVSVYAYAGYALLSRLVPRRPGMGQKPAIVPGELPRITVLVAAYNEAHVVRGRLENLLRQDYPPDRFEILVVSDGSDDGTDAIVASIEDPRVRLVRQEPRAGKTAGINLLGGLAKGEILVQTDANVLFGPGCLRALALAFTDPRVGVAVGEVVFTNADEPEVAAGEGLYWRFETWTKRGEAERGLLCVANGGVYALRRSLWRPLPPWISGDAAEPLIAAREGFATVVVPEAIAYEHAAASLAEELARKARIISQQVACARWIGLTTLPLRTLWSYVSHKLLRYAVPLMLLFAFACALASMSLGSWIGAALAAAIVAPFLIAPVGLLKLPGPLGKLPHVALYLAMINLASVRGMARGLAGRANATWETPASTRSAAIGSDPRIVSDVQR